MKSLFLKISEKCSKLTTKNYSTSFSLGIQLLEKRFQQPIYNIYGFVRFADEIVDSFHNHNQQELLDNFKKDCFQSIKQKISLNPILHSFQSTVNQYNIDHQLIDKFLDSMYMDLEKHNFNQKKYKQYIIGSAEVVGLMCLKVFVDGDNQRYQDLTSFACSLGSAFQKVNFLRDLASDYNELGRIYFPNINFQSFNKENKNLIEKDINQDFKNALIGIKKLPKNSRLGVYIAYTYYLKLLDKITRLSADKIKNKRVRINNFHKFQLMTQAIIKNKLGLI